MSTNTLALVALLAGGHAGATWLSAIRRGRAAARSAERPEAAPRSWPPVSVLVPAWRERGTVEACIESLGSVAYGDWEAIIIAGGPDGTYEAARTAARSTSNVRVIPQTPRGKNAALNEGFRVARGEVIVLLDADTTAAPTWLSALVAPIRDDAVATTGRLVPRRRTAVSRAREMEQIAALDIRNAVALQGGASIALHRRTLERLGGFAEDVIVGTDWDLDIRLAAIGVQRLYCPEAAVRTEVPATLAEHWRNEIRWRRAHLASIARHPGHFLGSPARALQSLYLYGLAWSVACATAVTVAIALASPRRRGPTAIRLWAIGASWLALRRAALAAEVAAFTGQRTYLGAAWLLPVLLGSTFVAIIPASLTVHRSTPHFKGPRPVEQT